MSNRAAEVLILELINTADEYKRAPQITAKTAQELNDLQTAVKDFDQDQLNATAKEMEQIKAIVSRKQIKEALAIDPDQPAIYPNDGPERAAEQAIIENWYNIMDFLIRSQADKVSRRYYEPIMEIMRPLIPEQGNNEEQQGNNEPGQ